MRGDSRRDLYSKTLALCGLGLLAGAGALVDYWPVGVRFPLATSPVAPATGTQATLMSPDEALVLATRLIDEVPRRQMAQVAVAPADVPETPLLAVASLPFESLPVSDVGFDIGAPIDVLALPAPAFINVRYEAPVLPGAPIRRLQAPEPERLDRGFPAAAGDDDGGNFLASAFRKTGSSIVKGSAKTGTSLVDAMRVVGGVFRRVLPN